MSNHEHHVAVLGASPKPGRYANMAIRLLKQKGYSVIPVHPRFTQIEELDVINNLNDIRQPVDTLTLYVGSEKVALMSHDIIQLKPGRVIFNPGTESASLQQALDNAGIEWLEACTLVMLKTAVF